MYVINTLPIGGRNRSLMLDKAASIDIFKLSMFAAVARNEEFILFRAVAVDVSNAFILDVMFFPNS